MNDVANVLLQDGPVEVEEQELTAQEAADVKADEAGEAEVKADTEQGEVAEHKKRLGGYARKAIKAQQEAEYWRKEALRRSEPKPEEKAETKPDADKPALKLPKLSDFPGTIEEFDKAQATAQADYDKAMERWLDGKKQTEAIEKQVESRLVDLDSRLAKLPELAEMRKAVKDSHFPERLTRLLLIEAAKVKHGEQVLKDLLLDTEEREQLMEFDTLNAGDSIVAHFHAAARAVRLAGKKPEAEVVDEENAPPPKKAPEPITPVKKVAPTATGLSDDLSPEEWLRRRNASLRKK